MAADLREIMLSAAHRAGLGRILDLRRVQKGEVAVLMFHRVSDAPDPLWPPLPVNTFRRLIAAIARSAKVVPLDELPRLTHYPRRPLIVISFDDGYKDFIENAAPILQQLGVPAHHNVCPGLIDRGRAPWTQVLSAFLRSTTAKVLELPGGRSIPVERPITERGFLEVGKALLELPDDVRERWTDGLEAPTGMLSPLMTWDDLRRLRALGFQCGSHGQTHRNLPAVTDPLVLEEEIGRSRRRIETELGTAPIAFAFPNGRHSPASITAVREAGYRFGLLTGDVAVRLEDLTDCPFALVPRINITRPSWRGERLRASGLHQKLKQHCGGGPSVLPRDVVRGGCRPPS